MWPQAVLIVSGHREGVGGEVGQAHHNVGHTHGVVTGDENGCGHWRGWGGGDADVVAYEIITRWLLIRRQRIVIASIIVNGLPSSRAGLGPVCQGPGKP